MFELPYARFVIGNILFVNIEPPFVITTYAVESCVYLCDGHTHRSHLLVLIGCRDMHAAMVRRSGHLG